MEPIEHILKVINQVPEKVNNAQDKTICIDIDAILNILTDISLHQPGAKHKRSFTESLVRIINICCSCDYGDSWRLVRLLKTGPTSSDAGLEIVLSACIGRFEYLEYVIKSSLEHRFDLFGALPNSVKRQEERHRMQLMLYINALVHGSFADVLVLIRYGISLDGIWDDKESGISKTAQIMKSCLIVHVMLSYSNLPEGDLRKILMACMEAAPYPVPTVEEFRRYESMYFGSDEMHQRMARILPEWAMTRSTAPRSLKHLARCSVRGRLAESSQLPKGIAELEIPTELKEYLSL